MSFVSVAPEALLSAAADIESIGSAVRDANACAAAAATGVVAAGRDEVSAAIAGLFSDYVKEYQA